MKKKYKVLFIFPVIVVVVFFGLLSMTEVPLLCDDQILKVDDCRNYLQGKYSKLSMFEHFTQTYPEAMPLYFESKMFVITSVTASSILDEKIFAFLSFNLEDSTFIYSCHNHNLGEDYLMVNLEDPTIEMLDDNHCGILNQLGRVHDI